MPDDITDEQDDEPLSKSQRKRDSHALRDLGERLLDVPEEQLLKLKDQDLQVAIIACKKITKGNARKRQLQYIGKLLRKSDPTEAQSLVDRMDASSRAHVQKFHQLEQWRDRLIAEDSSAVEEITSLYPQADRQRLRQLVRAAITEQAEERQPPVNYRKLFQYLKSLADQ